LTEPLSPEEKRAWIEHLQEIAKQRELSFEEWKTIFDSMKINTPLSENSQIGGLIGTMTMGANRRYE
jgi:hypothetical protein